jgi:hypothetical protein
MLNRELDGQPRRCAAGHDIAGGGKERTSPETRTARVAVVSMVEVRNGT